MDRKTYNRVVMDLLIGVVCGAIMYFSMIAYLVVFGLAVAIMIILVAKGVDLSTFGNNKDGNFSTGVIITRIVTVNIGVAIGLLALTLVF